MSHPYPTPESRTTHHGIPVLTRDTPGPITGTLHFAVGRQDEPLHRMGITHLLEHLVHLRMGPLHPAHNAEVGADGLSFWAVGSPDEVAAHLNAVAAAIGAVETLTDADVQREKKILDIENPASEAGFREGMQSYRHGAYGLGRHHLGEAAVRGVSRDDLLAWARQWLTVGNAALTFTGPVPATLDVRLPDGVAVAREPAPPRGHPSRALIRSEKVGVGFSIVSDGDEPELLGEVLAHEITQRLRHEAGLIYSVERWIQRGDDSTWHCFFVLDPRPDDTVETTVRLVGLLDELRTRPLAEASVQAARVVRRVDLDCVVPAVGAHLDERAVDLLRGRSSRTLEESYAAAMSDPDLLRERLTAEVRAALDTLQVAVDDDVPDDEGRLESLGLTVVAPSAWQPDPTRVRGANFSSRRGGPLGPGTSLTLAADRIQGRVGGGAWGGRRGREAQQDTIHFADVVAALRLPDGSLVLLDHRGCRAVLEADDWQRGDELLRRLAAALSPVLLDVGEASSPPVTG